ncbi:MAG: NUDIX hydrolase, partial [Pseudomonadota bacterium]
MSSESPKDAIRDAATVILLRREGEAPPRILMGQRGKGAAFMPSKFVFPGGAVDASDGAVPAPDLPPELARLLAAEAREGLAKPLAMAAIRELWEETGLALAHPGEAQPGPHPPGWDTFFAAGHRPALDRLT